MRIFTGGAVHTMVPGLTPQEAIAIDGELIVAVGSREEVAARAPKAERIDLGGKAIVPGFIDPHHHMCIAVLFAHAAPCGPHDAPTIDEIVKRLQVRAASVPEGAWVVGYDYDAQSLPGGAHPTREHLDAACVDKPVLLMHYSHHEAVVNSRALREAGIDRDTPDPHGGVIVRDRHGNPTGRLIEAAMQRCDHLARESLTTQHAEDWVRDAIAHQAQLFATGITRIHDPIVSPALEALYQRARAEGLKLSVVLSPLAPGSFMQGDAARLDGPPSGEGSDASRVGPVKMVLDGAERCAMCLTLGQIAKSALATAGRVLTRFSLTPMRSAMGAPFRRGGDGKLHRGLLFYDTEAAQACVKHATDRGFDLMLHAIGNEAVDVALDAIESAPARRRFPPRIEHATFTTELHRKRIADLGIVISTQASFLGMPGISAAPPVSGLAMLPFRSFLDSGVTLAFSSDHPVTAFDPLHGIRCAVTRKLSDGRIHDRDQRISVEQAIAGYTRGAAIATGSLDVCGTLEAGKRADLVVLSEDPYAGDALERVRVVETLLAGDSVYSA
ncbi:MAG: amidohydrolase [Deltaproteobacteria bacterium]|nr:amidohydrolase [Deltaproteobacteria bacterium]